MHVARQVQPRIPPAVLSEEIEVTSSAGQLRRLGLESDWRRLVLASPSRNPFMSWEWAETWTRRLCGDSLRTVVVKSGREVVAIAPFYERIHGRIGALKFRKWELFGPREFQHLFELREILVAPGFERSALQAMLAYLAGPEGPDVVELAASGDQLSEWFWAAKQQDRLKLAWHQDDVVPILELRRSWAEQRTAFSRSAKEGIRHSGNSLKRHGFQWEYESDSPQGSWSSSLDDFFRFHRLRSQARGRHHHPDYFVRRELRDLVAEAATRMHDSGLASIETLRVGGEPVAARLAFRAHDHTYYYFSGFDPAWWGYGVMTLLVTESIKNAIARGLRAINFSPGSDRSKTRWGVHYQRNRQFVLVRDDLLLTLLVRRRFLTRRLLKRIRKLLVWAHVPPVHTRWRRLAAGW